MPKRLCALRLIENEQEMTEEEEVAPGSVTIMCADKFGDVYSLPLVYTPREKSIKAAELSTPKPTVGDTEKLVKAAAASTPKPKVDVTPRGKGIITTERNKRAAAKSEKIAVQDSLASLEAKELPFEHKLLLGHVSLLIDVLPVTLAVEIEGGQKKERTWILSSDKDEHIRVTRYPNTYVIEGFCHGHTSYVSTLLVPSWDRSTLVSGGGDNFLLKWDWQSGRILQKIELEGYVMGVVGIVEQNKDKIKQRGINKGAMDVDSAAEEEFQVSVTGLWDLRDEIHGRNQILVAVEGYIALLKIYFHSGKLLIVR